MLSHTTIRSTHAISVNFSSRTAKGNTAVLFEEDFLRRTPFTNIVTFSIGINNVTLNVLGVQRSPRSTCEQDAGYREALEDELSSKGDVNAAVIDWQAR